MPRFAYVNGRYVPHRDGAVHIEDRGFQFADSIYEVVALIDGRMADEVGHLDRLERSLKELQIPMPMPRRSLQLVMAELARRNRVRNGAFYMQVTRGVAMRDFKFPKDVQPTLVMTVYAANFDLDARKVVPHHADTVLLEPKERLRVAIKADNPGDWMFHCHIIEHQDTGMMGYIRVV